MREEGAEQGKQLAQRVQGKSTRKPDAQRRWESGDNWQAAERRKPPGSGTGQERR